MSGRLRFTPIRVALLALSLSAVASADFKLIDKPEVAFQVGGPGGLKIEGASGDLKASESGGKLTLTASVTNLKTGIGLRDDHLKKYIGAEKYPAATLVIDRSKLKLPDDNQESEGSVQGDLTLHGVTKPVQVKYHAKRTGSDYHVQGHTAIDITSFGIEKPCYLGVCTDTEVKLKAKFKLRD
jgi:polyisoprenoid-binding protein YceI